MIMQGCRTSCHILYKLGVPTKVNTTAAFRLLGNGMIIHILQGIMVDIICNIKTQMHITNRWRNGTTQSRITHNAANPRPAPQQFFKSKPAPARSTTTISALLQLPTHISVAYFRADMTVRIPPALLRDFNNGYLDPNLPPPLGLNRVCEGGILGLISKGG